MRPRSGCGITGRRLRRDAFRAGIARLVVRFLRHHCLPEELHTALQSDHTKSEAFDVIRSLVDEITLAYLRGQRESPVGRLGDSAEHNLWIRIAEPGGYYEPLISSFTWAILALGIFGGAFNVEIFRSGIEAVPKAERTQRQQVELVWLDSRRRAAQTAVKFATVSAAIISVVIGLLFISAYIEAQIGTLIATLWVLTMISLVAGLGFFLRETWLAAGGSHRKL